MQIYTFYHELPYELRYDFNRLFDNATEGDWFAVDTHTPLELERLASDLTQKKCEVKRGEDDSPFYFLIAFSR